MRCGSGGGIAGYIAAALFGAALWGAVVLGGGVIKSYELGKPRLSRTFPDGFAEPCAPTLAAKPPAGVAWVYEIKHDGCRSGPFIMDQSKTLVAPIARWETSKRPQSRASPTAQRRLTQNSIEASCEMMADVPSHAINGFGLTSEHSSNRKDVSHRSAGSDKGA
jgi:ATP-dependent DNA ligase